jgi:enamine deaminase RidA (YjgF/YER057c/UK114 family)
MLHCFKELTKIADTRPIVRDVVYRTFAGARGRALIYGGRNLGTVHECEDATYCFFEQVVPADLSASRGEQTTSIFETIDRVLRMEEMDSSHLVRTWFYLDHILGWHGEFNQARTKFLQSRSSFEGFFPASTDIGIANRFDAAIVAGALAIKPKNATIKEVVSPLQHPVQEYSRAVEVVRPGRRELYLSGTSSIDLDGHTAHVGDVKSQIDLTMEAAGAILKSRQMNWCDITRAIAYFKDARKAPVLTQYLGSHGLDKMPLTWMHGDICRSDLLFEIELDAVVKQQG